MAGGRPIEITILADAGKAASEIGGLADDLDDVAGALDDVDSSGGDAKRALDDVADATGDVDPKHIEDVSDALEDVDTASTDAKSGLDDVEKAAKDAGDAGKEIDRDLTKALEEADDAADKARAGLDDVEKSAKGAGTAAAGMDDDFKRAGETTATFSEETKQNLSESVSSFRGDVEDLPQLLQDVLGGASSSLSGIASLLAVGGAAVIGITIGQLQSLSDRINEAKEEMGAFAQEITEAGRGLDGVDLTARMREWAFEIQDARSWFEVWQTDAVNNLENVASAAEAAGVPLSAFWEAMVNPDTEVSNQYLADMKTRLSDVSAELATALENQGGYNAVSAETITALTDEKNALEGLIGPLETEVTAKQKAYDQSVILRAAESGVTEEVIRQRDAIAENNAEIERANDLKAEAAALNGDVFLAESNYTAAVQDATAAIAENGATIDVNTQAGRNNREALVDAAGASVTYAQTIAGAGGSQERVNGILQQGRTDFINMALAAGLSSTEADSLASSLGLVPDTVQTDIKVEGATKGKSTVEDYNAKVNTIPSEKTTTVRVSVPNFQQAVDDAARAIRQPTIVATVKLGRSVAV